MKTDYESLAASLARTAFYAEFPMDPRISDYVLDVNARINTATSAQDILATHLELEATQRVLKVWEVQALERAKAMLSDICRPDGDGQSGPPVDLHSSAAGCHEERGVGSEPIGCPPGDL